MLLRGRAFGEVIRSCTDTSRRDQCPCQRLQKSLWPTFFHIQIQENSLQPRTGPSPDPESSGTLILDLSASRIFGNHFLLFISHNPYGILFQLTKQTQTAANCCFPCKGSFLSLGHTPQHTLLSSLPGIGSSSAPMPSYSSLLLPRLVLYYYFLLPVPSYSLTLLFAFCLFFVPLTSLMRGRKPPTLMFSHHQETF